MSQEGTNLMNIASINEGMKIINSSNTILVPSPYELLSDPSGNSFETKYALPADIPLMDERELENWKVYTIDSHKDVAEEWSYLRTTIANKMLIELNAYSGREQQRKGTVIANVQRFVFGDTLPRGHGHRGRLSALMSSMFDDITGRTPRKRRAPVRSYQEPVKIHRTIIPHSIFIGVIGDSPLAKVISQRLLVCNYHVKIYNRMFYNQIVSDHSSSTLRNTPLHIELARGLDDLVQSSEVMIVANESPDMSETFYLHPEGFFSLLGKNRVVYDMALEDYQISSQIHQEAAKKGIRFYDAPMFPVPNTLLSYDLSPPSLFLGGESLPEEFAMNILYSLAVAIYPSRPNYGIINKNLVSHYYTLQTQVMHEMDIVSQSLGIHDDVAFSQMLSACCNPQAILTRNKQYDSKMMKDKQAQKLSIDTLISPIKRLYSIPLPQLPFTTIVCDMADKAVALQQRGDVDISSLWKTNVHDLHSLQDDNLPIA